MDDVGKNGTIVEYGINGLTFTAIGTVEKFTDGGAAKRVQYIHRVSQNILTVAQCRVNHQ